MAYAFGRRFTDDGPGGECIIDQPPARSQLAGTWLYFGVVTVLVWLNPGDWLTGFEWLLRLGFLGRP